MADDKKKAPAPSPFGKDHHKEVIYFVLPGLFFLSILINRLFEILDGIEYSALGRLWDRILLSLIGFWSIWKVAAVILSIGAGVAIWYCRAKLQAIDKEEETIYGSTPEDSFLENEPAQSRENERWQKVLAHANSNNPAEWRVAIVEADIMLDELLKRLGYDGAGVAEMLKKVEPSDMLTLDQAWEAHKIRNRIAHSGTEFELSEKETRRVISLFEEVFNEYQII